MILVIYFIIYFISFFLFKLPIYIVIYPTLINITITVCYYLYKYIKQRNKHKELEKVKKHLLDYHPISTTTIEKDLEEIIIQLQNHIKQLESTYYQKEKDMIDYYSLWIHQIKTPISSMYLILENMDNDESRKLKRNLHAIESYVQMVLAYMNIEATETDFVYEKLNLESIVNDSIKSFMNDFIERKIKLEYTPFHYSCILDKKWVMFIFKQILSNSLKYTNNGKISIYFKETTLYIEDNGIGIKKEDLPRIFEKGYTGYNGRINQKASGLGLYLVKEIVDKMHLNINIESEINAGTKVSINFKQYEIKQ